MVHLSLKKSNSTLSFPKTWHHNMRKLSCQAFCINAFFSNEFRIWNFLDISNEPRLYSLRTSLIILLEDRCTVMSCLLGLWLTIFAWYLARLLSGGSLTVHNGNSNASWVSPGSRRNKVPLCNIKCSFFVQRQRHYSVCHSAHKHHHKHNFDTLNRRNKSVNACYDKNNVQNCIHHSS